MTSDFDYINLRMNAQFEVRIAPNVYWVPVNTLGGSSFSVEEGKLLVGLTPDQKRSCVHTLYEAVLLYLLSGFHDDLDVVYMDDGRYNWEHHKPGYYAVLTNCGCCASEAAWLRYILDDRYEKMGYFAFSRPNGSGHILNYIFHEGWYYLYDLCTLSDRYVATALNETGDLKDYLKTRFITCALLKCKTLEDYARYFRRLQLRGGFDHLFFSYETSEVPPIASEKHEDILKVVLPDNVLLKSLLYERTDTMCVERVLEPSKEIDWESIIVKQHD